MIVSIYGSKSATTPSLTEYLVLAVEWAIAADPCPASLENNPRLTPIIIVFKKAITAPAPIPDICAGGLNAIEKIVLKDEPTFSKLFKTINKAVKT